MNKNALEFIYLLILSLLAYIFLSGDLNAWFEHVHQIGAQAGQEYEQKKQSARLYKI